MCIGPACRLGVDLLFLLLPMRASYRLAWVSQR